MDSERNSDYEQDLAPQNSSHNSFDQQCQTNESLNCKTTEIMKPNLQIEDKQNKLMSETLKINKEKLAVKEDNSKLQQTNELLQAQLLSLAKQIDEIVNTEKERRYNKYHKVSEASKNDTIQQLQQELGQIMEEIKKQKLQIQSFYRQIRNGEQINQIVSKKNIISNLKQEYFKVKEEQIAIKAVQEQIDKTLEGIQNSDFYKEKKKIVGDSIRKAKLEGQELNIQFEEINLELRDEHEQKVNKGQKIVKIHHQIHEKKVKENQKVNKNQNKSQQEEEEIESELITKEIVESLISKKNVLKTERIKLLKQIEEENKQKQRLQISMAQDFAQNFDKNNQQNQGLKAIQLKIRLLNQQLLLEALTKKRNLKKQKEYELLKNKVENKPYSQSASTTHKYSIQTKFVFSKQNAKPQSTQNKSTNFLQHRPQLQKKIIVKNKSLAKVSQETNKVKQLKQQPIITENKQQQIDQQQMEEQKQISQDNYSDEQFESIDQ